MMIDQEDRKIEELLTEKAKYICRDWHYNFNPLVVLNPRFKKTLGICTPEIEIIELNKEFVKLNPTNIVLEILKHELVHLKYWGHGKNFRRECERLGLKIHPGKNSNIKL